MTESEALHAALAEAIEDYLTTEVLEGRVTFDPDNPQIYVKTEGDDHA